MDGVGDLGLVVEDAGHGGRLESERFRSIGPIGIRVGFGQRDDTTALTVVARPLHADRGAEREKGKQRALQETSAEADGADLKAQDLFSLMLWDRNKDWHAHQREIS